MPLVRRRKSPLAASVLLHLLVLTFLFTRVEAPVADRKAAYSGILVYTPATIQESRPVSPVARVPRPVLPRPVFQAPLSIARPKTQMLEAPLQIPVIYEQVAPHPAPAVPLPDVPLPAVPPLVRQVQIGAFSAPAGEMPQTVARAPSGSAGFDAISSPGPAGAARIIMPGGPFDAAAGGGQQPYRRSVRAGGFQDATVAQVSATPKQSQSSGSLFRPVEILEKPKPAYTEEARRLGIQGEVVFEALFTSAGSIRVLKTLRGLGHGLDEAALRAAEAIHFRPAERDGQPVDFTAAVHIIFQLAN